MATKKILIDLDVNGDITGDSFVKDGGTSSQFLKADGSVDSSTYITSGSIPTNTSDLTNDSGFISSVTGDWTGTFDGEEGSYYLNYNNLSNKPTLFDGAYSSLSGLPTLAPSNAEQNVQSNWNAVSGDALILNKPTIPTATSDLTNDSGFLSSVTGDWTGTLDGEEGSYYLDYTNFTNKPTLFDGDYDSLSNLPTLAPSNAEQNVQSDWNATTGDALILNKPTLFDGDYDSLSNLPTLAPSNAEQNVQSDWNATTGDALILNKPTLFDGAYSSLSGLPTLFDGDYDSLSNLPTIPSGNSIIDWTIDQGATNIHANNYTDTNTFRAISSTPTNGATTTSISSDWAFDNVKTAVPTGALFTDTNTTYVSSDFTHDDLTGFVANEHIDWTADQGATNIHSGNYTNTNTWNANSKNVAGYVAAPGAVANKVWKTDASGNPAWRDDVDTDSNTFRTVAVDTNGDGSANNTLAAGETLQFKKGSNITLSEAAGVITISSTDTNTDTTYVSSDFTHDDLTGFVANEHIDWTTDQGSTNIHSGNYTDTNTWRGIDDTPVNGATTESISSNWAFDNVKTAVPADALFTDTNTTYVSSDFTHDDLTGFVAKEHLDWTENQGSNNIHTGNYTNTTYTAGNGLALSGIQFRMAGGSIGGSIDLNTYTSSGYYVQGSNANATSGSNYPTDNAGILTVVKAEGNNTHITQTYDQYNSSAFYNRSYYSGTWSSWRNLAQDSNTTYSSSDFSHDDLTGFVANEHIDWTTDQGSTNIHANNYTDTNTFRAISSTPTNGATSTSISSDWAFDNVKTAVPSGALFTDTNTTYVSSDFTHDDLTGYVPDEHIDWTVDQGATNIHANNYTNTNTFRAIHDAPVDGATTTSISSNWAFDNVKTAVPTGALFTDTNTFRAISSTPTNGATTTSISSDWAFDNVKTAVPTGALFTDTDTTYTNSDFNHNLLTGVVANEHIDWTKDQGATNIHSGNYTNTNTNQLTTFQVEDGDGTELTISHGKEWKFVEGQGINVNWTDTTPGSDADPFDLQFALKANGVRANELNVTGNGTSSQYLRSDGDGSFTWATPSNTVYDETNNVEAENLSTTGGTIPMWVGSATAGDVRILGNSPFQYDNTDAKIVFSGTERFTFASTGTFDADSGITAGGNSTINGNLDINGALDVFSTGGDQFMKMEQGIATVTIGDMDAVSWGSNFKIEGNTGTFKWEQDGAEQMRLTNASVLHVDSDVIAYSTTISDRRLKDDIQTIENASETVKKLRGVSYEWNAGNRKGQKEIGLVAQEVEEVLPFLVREHELPLTKGAIEGELYKTVDYEKLVGLLIEDSKEKDARIERLEAMVEIMLNK